MPSQPDRPGRLSRLAIVLGYLVLGVTWIAVSDRVVYTLVDITHQPVLETIKGTLFVVITAGGLWLVLAVRDARLARGRQALAASEERYRMLAERSQDVVYRYVYQPTRGFEYISPSVEALTGYAPEELQAPGAVARLVLDDDDHRLRSWLQSDSHESLVVRWRHRDGRILWTEHVVTRLRDAEGRLVAVEGTARDVTARIAAEAQSHLLQHLVDASPVGVLVTGGPGDGLAVRYVNPALATMLGQRVEDLVGPPGAMSSVAHAILAGDPVAARVATGQPFTFEAELPVAAGDPLPVSILVSPTRAEDGAVDSVIALVSDRSEAIGRLQAESRLRAVLDASPLAVVAMDPDGIVTSWNPAAERLFGWTAEEAVGHLLPLVDEAGWSGGRERRAQLAAGIGDPATVRTVTRKDGVPILCATTTGVIHDETGRVIGFMNVSEDLTEKRRHEDWNALLRQAIDQAAEAVVITELDGTITYVNPAFAQVSGYAEDELVGANPRVLQSGLTPPHVYADMWAKLSVGDTWRGMFFNRRKDGSLYEEEATLSPVIGSGGKPIAYLGVKRDVTIERRLASGLSAELRDRAAVQEAMARIDLRDTAEETAQAVCEALSAFDGVDEAVILYLPPRDGALVPIGMAAVGRPDTEPFEPLDAASSAHYRKRAVEGPWAHSHLDRESTEHAAAGTWFEHQTYVAAPIHHRDRLVALLIAATDSPSPDSWIARHLRVVTELAVHAAPLIGPQLVERDATVTNRLEIERLLDDGAFAPVFQPVCDLATQQPIGWEALTRFTDGSQPTRRFREAHAVGLGDRLELACALRALERFYGLARPGWLSLNVSPSLVLSGAASALAGAINGAVVLEITERVPIEDYVHLRRAIDQLAPLVMIAVDDAGAGYASLRNVLELRPDFVKLDVSFISGIDRDPARQAMVAGMVHYASETNTQLIAEGVQTASERLTLLRLGVRYGQGFLLGAPSLEAEVAPGPTGSVPKRDPHATPGTGVETWAGTGHAPAPAPPEADAEVRPRPAPRARAERRGRAVGQGRPARRARSSVDRD